MVKIDVEYRRRSLRQISQFGEFESECVVILPTVPRVGEEVLNSENNFYYTVTHVRYVPGDHTVRIVAERVSS
jgi:hypothetical protein